MIADAIAKVQKTFCSWKRALEGVGLKVNLVKTKVLLSKIGQINVIPSSKKDQCGICGEKTMEIAVLCRPCDNWIHGRYGEIKSVTNSLAIDFIRRKCIGRHVDIDQEDRCMMWKQ